MNSKIMHTRRTILKAATSVCAGALLAPFAARAQQDAATKVESQARSALRDLYAKNSASKAIGAQALAVLVFPKVTRVGLIVGGQHGEGALFKGNAAKGKAAAFYSTSGVSAGMQAGAQNFGYAMFFMNDNALSQLDKADGWEVGVGPTLVVVDSGFAKNLTTTTLQDDIYAFVFDQKGLMAGIGVQGNRIARIEPR